MKQIKWMTVLVMLVITTIRAHAQRGEVQMSISHVTAIPMGSFTDAVKDVSPRGGSVAILYGLTDKLSLGGNVAFQDFYQKYPRQLYSTTDGSHVSAVLTNSIQVTPILFSGQYNFLPGRKVQPYASLGVGANVITYAQMLGEFTNDSRNKIGFAARPALGVNFPLVANRLNIGVGAAYNYMPFNYGGIDNLNSLSIQGGISFALRR